MATIPAFDPPAALTDFDTIPAQRAAWDEFIALSFQRNVEDVDGELGTEGQFYNPKVTSTDPPVATKVIRWKGFPLVIASQHPGNRKAAWADAEQLGSSPAGPFRRHDEYLEWFTTRNADGKIARIVFTCEGPEYWEALAHGYPAVYTRPRSQGGLGGTKHTNAQGDLQKLLALYRQHVSPAVQLADLLDASGRYNRCNKWNTTQGAMHLTHGANTLGAEINIAAQATIRRQRNGQPVTGADDLIRCAGFGVAARASDPHIGDEVNTLARGGFAISLLNPVGLYMEAPNTQGWTTPNGRPASDFWTAVRGATGMTVRAMFEVPASEGYTVSDVKIGGQVIEFAGQIAERIDVKLTGIACRAGTLNPPARPCSAGVLALAGGGESSGRSRR